MVYYDDIDILPIFNWDKYIKSQNNNWFIKGFDGRQPIQKNNELAEIEKKVQDQYFLELDDRGIISRMQKMAKIDNLITKYNMAMLLLNRCKIGFTEQQQEVKKEFHLKLSMLGFKIKTDTPEELKDLFQIAEGIKTQIAIIENEIAPPQKVKPRSLMFQLKIVEKGLGFTVALNPKKVTVKEFIELCKEMENAER